MNNYCITTAGSDNSIDDFCYCKSEQEANVIKDLLDHLSTNRIFIICKIGMNYGTSSLLLTNVKNHVIIKNISFI